MFVVRSGNHSCIDRPLNTHRTELIVPESYDLAKTLWLAGMGSRDPSLQVGPEEAWLGFHTGEGPVTVHGRLADRTLDVTCFGPGSDWVEPRLAGLFGLDDDPSAFCPGGKLGELVHANPGMHLPRIPVVFHRLTQIVLQQLVVWSDALRGWLRMTERYGTDAPGPMSLRIGPSPERLAELGYYDVVDCGVMPKQARLILQLARERNRIERLAEAGPAALEKYLLSVRGVGPWTVAHLQGTSMGVADALLVGDYGLPHTVAWFLADKERSNDEEMTRLLQPFSGHRFRVVNLLWQSGIEAPRRGPKQRSNRWRFTRRG